MEYELTDNDLDKLCNIFTYHKPIGNQSDRYDDIRNTAKNFAMLLKQVTPPSREQSIALTKLEEVCFWANAAIARNEKEA